MIDLRARNFVYVTISLRARCNVRTIYRARDLSSADKEVLN